VIEAVDSGHRSARSIIRYLSGEQLEPPPAPELPVVHLSRQEIEERMARGEIRRQPRVPLPELPVEQRIRGFAEVEGGYDDESAQREAARCLACGICSECMSCTFACGVQAIDHDMVARQETLTVGGVVLAPGYQVYRAELSEEYGFGRYPNVVTALQYERMLSASGPSGGHIQRPSDGKDPRRVAFLQCVGSRDQSHDYCSAVCCMYAAKEAIMTIEHARAAARGGEPADVECSVFFMDTRAFSKGYEEYYHRAEGKYGVRYIRCRASSVTEDPRTHNLRIRYASDAGDKHPVTEEEFDLVVLSVGMEIAEPVKDLARRLGVELDEYGFCHTTLFDPLQTSQPGIYVAGPFREPKDIPETVIEASGAAASVAGLLAPARFTLTQTPEYLVERDVTAEDLRIGVFVCHCGSNIGGYLDVPGVAEYARGLPGVVHAEDNLYTCSQNTITHIIDQVKEQGLNRVVVASCSPLTHEPLFQDAIRQAGLNPYLFEMVNIRNQCSWVHSADWDHSTEKARTLVRMGVARAAQLEPLRSTSVQVNPAALVLGGGVAGMTAALVLAEQGFPVHLVERADSLGGNLRRLRYFVDQGDGRSPGEYLEQIVNQVQSHPLIGVYLRSELLKTEGFKGDFTSTLRTDEGLIQVKHGVAIVATGGVEYSGTEYGYGSHPRILSQLGFEEMLADLEAGTGLKEMPGSVVMIQCVGPADKYCSRLCCTTALKNALKLKQLAPTAQVTIVYRDIRTYGFKEKLYTAARREGVQFIRYDFDHPPEVLALETDPKAQYPLGNPPLMVKVKDPALGEELILSPDLLVLSMPVIPSPGSQELASRLKLSIGADGFFLEANVKLRPIDFTTEGFFMAGMAHYPKFIDETIAQARAAASRAAAILSRESILANPRVAVVDPARCVGCLTCVRICPFDIPRIDNGLTGVGSVIGAAYIEPSVCRGCGICAAECPAKAIQVMHSKDVQTLIKVDAIFSPVPSQQDGQRQVSIVDG
jgi:heterodisulfide reductase subunit A-like polyferredoxin